MKGGGGGLAILPDLGDFRDERIQEVHLCGVFTELDGLDSTLNEDVPERWCWSKNLSFHRPGTPGTPYDVILHRPDRVFTALSITPAEAVAIGAGIRHADADSLGMAIGETLYRLLSFTDADYYWGEAEFWARFGHAAAGKAWIDHDPSQLHYITRLMVAGVLQVIPQMDCVDAYRRLLAGEMTTSDREAIDRSRRGSVIVSVLADGVTYPGVAAKSIELYLRSINTPRALEIERIIDRVTAYLEALK